MAATVGMTETLRISTQQCATGYGRKHVHCRANRPTVRNVATSRGLALNVRALTSSAGPKRNQLSSAGRSLKDLWARRFGASSLDVKSNPLEDELLALLGDGTLESISENGRSRTDANKRVEELVELLQQQNPTEEPNKSANLPGRWRLLSSFKPGTATVNFFSLSDWNNYLFNDGPSPVQNLVVGNTKTVSRVYQVLQLAPENRFLNIVDFSKESGGILVIAAVILGFDGPSNIKFRFANGFFLFKRLFGRELDTPLKVLYPVPFALLGERANGGLDTTYLNNDLRISVGSKGTVFVLQREEEDDSISLDGFI